MDLREIAVLAERRERPAMRGVRVVGVDHVASRAAGRTVVAGVVVGAEEIQRRIEQPRLLQVEPHRIGAVQGPEPALAEPVGRLRNRQRQAIRSGDDPIPGLPDGHTGVHRRFR